MVEPMPAKWPSAAAVLLRFSAGKGGSRTIQPCLGKAALALYSLVWGKAALAL